jgi:hypothetical protein
LLIVQFSTQKQIRKHQIELESGGVDFDCFTVTIPLAGSLTHLHIFESS